MTETASLAESDPADALPDLAPSAKLVAKTLSYEGELTQAQIAEQTLLPDRTVRSALRALERADLVASRTSLTDARKQVYGLATGVEL